MPFTWDYLTGSTLSLSHSQCGSVEIHFTWSHNLSLFTTFSLAITNRMFYLQSLCIWWNIHTDFRFTYMRLLSHHFICHVHLFIHLFLPTQINCYVGINLLAVFQVKLIIYCLWTFSVNAIPWSVWRWIFRSPMPPIPRLRTSWAGQDAVLSLALKSATLNRRYHCWTVFIDKLLSPRAFSLD